MELQGDEQVVMAAVSQEGAALQYASVELQGDKEVVLAALAQSEDTSKDDDVLQYTTAELRAEISAERSATENLGFGLSAEVI